MKRVKVTAVGFSPRVLAIPGPGGPTAGHRGPEGAAGAGGAEGLAGHQYRRWQEEAQGAGGRDPSVRPCLPRPPARRSRRPDYSPGGADGGPPHPTPHPSPVPLKPLHPRASWLPSRLLNEATGSLLDDVQLVNTLQTSKITATEVTEQLETSETTEINIDLAREVSPCALRPGPLLARAPAPPALTPPPPQAYRPCAQRASVLFFVLNDMGRIDPMYQFSLDAYISLFILSIDKSHRSNKLEDRIDYLNEYHTYAVYRSARLPARRASSAGGPVALRRPLLLLVPSCCPMPPLLSPCSSLHILALGGVHGRGLTIIHGLTSPCSSVSSLQVSLEH